MSNFDEPLKRSMEISRPRLEIYRHSDEGKFAALLVDRFRPNAVVEMGDAPKSDLANLIGRFMSASKKREVQVLLRLSHLASHRRQLVAPPLRLRCETVAQFDGLIAPILERALRSEVDVLFVLGPHHGGGTPPTGDPNPKGIVFRKFDGTNLPQQNTVSRTWLANNGSYFLCQGTQHNSVGNPPPLLTDIHYHFNVASNNSPVSFLVDTADGNDYQYLAPADLDSSGQFGEFLANYNFATPTVPPTLNISDLWVWPPFVEEAPYDQPADVGGVGKTLTVKCFVLPNTPNGTVQILFASVSGPYSETPQVANLTITG